MRSKHRLLTKERTAPNIVRLDAASVFKDAWLQEGWSQRWGILCYAPELPSEVSWRFRNFLQAMLPVRRVALFRFYDPRIWRVYLPTCNADALTQWFRTIEEFIAETADGKGMIRYRCRDGSLETNIQQL